MKMTLIDWTIVFAVSNVVFSGFFIKHEEPYAPPPICRMNPDGTLVEPADARCVTRLSDPAQTPPQSSPARP